MLTWTRETAGRYTARAASGAVYTVSSTNNEANRTVWNVARNGVQDDTDFPTYSAAKAHAEAVAVLNDDNNPENNPRTAAAVAGPQGEADGAPAPRARRPRRTPVIHALDEHVLRAPTEDVLADETPVTSAPTLEAELVEDDAAEEIAEAIDGPAVQFALLPDVRPEGSLANVALSRIRPGRVTGAPEDLVESVRRFGVLQPVALIRHGANGFDIADGRRRFSAATAADLGVIPALIFPEGTPRHVAAAITLTTNMQRRPNPASELEAIQQMVAEGASVEQIARELRLSVFVIRRRMALANLIPAFRDLLLTEELAITTAQRVARHPAGEQEALLQVYRTTGRVTAEDRAAQRRARAGGQAEALHEARGEAPVLVDLNTVTLQQLAAAGARLGVRFTPAVAADDAPAAPANDADAEYVEVQAPVAPAPEAALPAGHGWAVVLTCLERAEDSVPVSPDDHTDGFYADLSALMGRVRRIVTAAGA